MTEVRISELVADLRGSWKVIAAAAILSAAVSVTYAIQAQEWYRSSAQLVPTTPQTNQDLGAAAALFGKSNSLDDLELYQALIKSRDVLGKVLVDTIVDSSRGTKGVRAPISSLLAFESATPDAMDGAISRLDKRVSLIRQSAGTGGIFHVSAEAQSPWLARAVLVSLLEHAMREMKDVHLRRSDSVLARLEGASVMARAEWDDAMNSLKQFQQSNRAMATPEMQVEQSRFELERQVKEQKYLMARKEAEQLRLEREKWFPPAVLLNLPTLPPRKIRPQRTLIVFAGTLAGVFLSSLLICILGLRKRFVSGRLEYSCGP